MDGSEHHHEEGRLPVSDASARVLLLVQIIALAGAGRLNARQVSPHLIERLRRLTTTEAMKLAAMDCGIAITIDHATILYRIATLEAEQQSEVLMERFVAAGASIPLVTRLFRRTSDEVRTIRRLFTSKTGGRPRLPEDPIRAAILSSWNALTCTGMPETERWWQLHRQYPEYPIVSLERVLRETQDVGGNE